MMKGHSKPVLCDKLEGWDGERGAKGVQQRDICTPNADSCWRMAKIVRIL